MCAFDKNDDLAKTIEGGYGAPPPREAFVRDLGRRMQAEFRAARIAPATPRPHRVALLRWPWAAAAAASLLVAAGIVAIAVNYSGNGRQTRPTVGSPAPFTPSSTPEDRLVPLDTRLPGALYECTPRGVVPSPHLEPYDSMPRAEFKVPEGTVNLALGKPVTASQPLPLTGELGQVTDGDKESADSSYVDLGAGRQWIQIDLQQPCQIYAVLVWHFYAERRVYHDMVVQVSDDPDFTAGAKTLYNNDYDDSSGLGAGRDLEYIDDYRGRLIDAKGITGRYVRLYSNGNSSNDLNHYVEVEVYGRPLGAAPAAAPAAASAQGPRGPAGPQGAVSQGTAEKKVPLDIKLPRAKPEPTPKNIKPSPYIEPYSEKPRPPFAVPQGTVNLALGKPVTSSDPNPVIGELKQITDGDKEGDDGSYVDLGPGAQWVQIDLKEPCTIYAILLWHYHGERRVYHDVVVQAADDPDFIENVRTVYNNDFDNSAGLGVGKDLEYIDDYRGRLIDARGVGGRYVRLYSKGNSANDLNNYIEVEVHGKPLAAPPAAAPK